MNENILKNYFDTFLQEFKYI